MVHIICFSTMSIIIRPGAALALQKLLVSLVVCLKEKSKSGMLLCTACKVRFDDDAVTERVKYIYILLYRKNITKTLFILHKSLFSSFHKKIVTKKRK